MKKQLKRLLPVICTGIVTFSAGFLADGKVEAAVKTPALSKKNASLTVGKSVTLKVKKGTDNIKKVTWKSDKKKNCNGKEKRNTGRKSNGESRRKCHDYCQSEDSEKDLHFEVQSDLQKESGSF